MNMNADREKQLQEQEQRIENTLKKITHRIVVFSGKGGVGKTTVAVNLAYALVKKNFRVGLLDADITGPNVPKMVGLHTVPWVDKDNKFIKPMEKDGLQIISMAPMIPEEAPIIWRGPLRSGAISQFLSDVVWGELDFLLADLPPGTGDEVLTTAQKMLPQMAIVVTTPQEVAITDCRRAVNMAKKLNIAHVSVVENMSGLVCPHCKEAINLFGDGGGERMAREMNAQFLGKIPMELDLREGGDAGVPAILADAESTVAERFLELSEKIVEELQQ